MSCLVRTKEFGLAYMTEENISRARARSNVATPRPLPIQNHAISKLGPKNPGPQPLVRQPTLKPPSRKVPKYTPKVGEKRNISKQELKIILDSIKEIRNKIRYGDLTCEDKIDYQIQLMKLSRKLC